MRQVDSHRSRAVTMADIGDFVQRVVEELQEVQQRQESSVWREPTSVGFSERVR
jgi:hypothetical protein